MSTVQEVFNKLQKLRHQASAAVDFPTLEKVEAKVEKIRAKLSEHRNHKELLATLDTIQKLVSERKKYFRHIIIKNSQQSIEQNTRNEDADKTLKYSKSAENFKVFSSKTPKQIPSKTSFISSKTAIDPRHQTDIETADFRKINDDNRRKKNMQQIQYNEVSQELVNSRGFNVSKKHLNHTTVGSAKSIIQNKYEQNEQDIDKTTVNEKKSRNQQQNEDKLLKGEVDFLEQKLSYSFKQIEDLNKKIAALQDFKEKNSQEALQPTSPSAKNLLAKQQSIVDEYGRKLREKNFVIQDLKSKMEYFKMMNEQLKNKIINQQRRNEDYVQTIKQDAKNLRKQVDKLKRQNQTLKFDVEDLEQKNQGLLNQVKKLVNRLEEEAKDKQNLRRNLTGAASSKTQELQKQIANLTTQCFTLSKLEVDLQHEKEEKTQLIQFRRKLQYRVAEIETEYKKVEDERNKLELELYKMEQDKKNLQTMLKVSNQAKQILADELLEARQQMEDQVKMMNMNQYQKELRTKNKVNKLKEVKGLLNELR